MAEARYGHNDFPVGIPLRPPPGWKGRGSCVPPPLPRRAPKSSARGLVLKAGLVVAMVQVCMAVGWLAVSTPRRHKEKPTLTKVAPEPVAEAPREGPKPAAPDLPKEPPREPPKEPPNRPPAPPAEVPTYERDILPIVRRSCIGCHSAAKKRGKLDLSSFAAALKGGEGGPAVTPGKPNDSPILATVVEGSMPPGGKRLPERDIRRIREWLQSGARSDSSK